MKKHAPKDIKIRCIIWLATYVILGLVSNIYMIYNENSTGTYPIGPLSAHSLFVMAVCALFFIPLGIDISHRAKRCDMKRLAVISRIVVIAMGIWILFSLLISVLMLILPSSTT